MATTSDPRASSFDAAAFRDAIHFAMNMGLPDTPSERVTFRWKPERDYSIEDKQGNPYDFAATPTSQVIKEDVLVPAAVEFASNRAEGGVSFGEFDNPRGIVTVLDEEYELVKPADQVILGGNTYFIRYWGPPMGLFPVTIYQCFITAVDES